MLDDPIVKETHEARERLFARFDYDRAALCRLVTLLPRKPHRGERRRA
jgi:hypothetical protein